jgi:hypothetical protein
MIYTTHQRTVATSWKLHSEVLPDDARLLACYVRDGVEEGEPLPFCLPRGLAAHNLLPGVRDDALGLFQELQIPWHQGVDEGPTNHLLSSQVQCVNALAGMVEDPSRIARAFSSVIDIGAVEQIEPGRFLTFEYIGPTDYFGEAVGRRRVRGARCTSVDAAFQHRLPDGTLELVLVEWKYTESYRLRAADPRGDSVRRRKYARFIDDPTGPVRADLLPFDLLLDEPFYQLARQQLLAHQLETAGVADRVRVVHVCPRENDAYQSSVHRPEQRALGSTVSEVWQQLIRHHDRFTSMDPTVFLDEEVTSRDYVLRYAPDVVWSEPGLRRHLRVSEEDDLAEHLETAVDWSGDVELTPDEVVLRHGTVGWGLVYPFRWSELWDLSYEVDPEA